MELETSTKSLRMALLSSLTLDPSLTREDLYKQYGEIGYKDTYIARCLDALVQDGFLVEVPDNVEPEL